MSFCFNTNFLVREKLIDYVLISPCILKQSPFVRKLSSLVGLCACTTGFRDVFLQYQTSTHEVDRNVGTRLFTV